tara:strand:- start:1455 stop:2747 length:1293 start_codon:yes stop_codon:yes gene_type:complete
MRQKISMICPTRERTKMLDRFVKNIFDKGTDNIKNKDYFELLLIVDNDDEQTKDFFAESLSEYPTIKMINRERSEFFNRDYLNFGASKTSGDLIWGVADDVEIITDNWDLVLNKRVNEFESYVNQGYLANMFHNWMPEEMAYLINIDCDDGDFELYEFCRCSFPMITREAYQKLNLFLPIEWKFWGADYGLGEIYRRAGKVLSLEEFQVAHWTYNNKNEAYRREEDEINKRTKALSGACTMLDASFREQEAVINKYVKMIREKRGPYFPPSKISLANITSPLEELIQEIAGLKIEIKKYAKEMKHISVDCPECLDRLLPLTTKEYEYMNGEYTCPLHPVPMSQCQLFIEDDKITSSCAQPECDWNTNLLDEEYLCEICGYKGKFIFYIENLLNAAGRHNNLSRRYAGLIKKLGMLFREYDNNNMLGGIQQ